VKKALKYTKARDPLNYYGVEDILQIVYYATFFIPVIMMWDLFEEFSTVKIVLIGY